MTNVDLLYQLIDRGREGKNIGLNTGSPKIDGYTGGIQRGNYTLIFGLSGSGKSA
jgi:replicative DNA helicase